MHTSWRREDAKGRHSLWEGWVMVQKLSLFIPMVLVLGAAMAIGRPRRRSLLRWKFRRAD